MTLHRLDTRSLVKLYWSVVSKRDRLPPHWFRSAAIAERIHREIARRSSDARLLPRR
jgi:hypothetical protein